MRGIGEKLCPNKEALRGIIKWQDFLGGSTLRTCKFHLILRVVLGSIFGSVLGASLGFFDFLNHFMIIFGAGAKIVGWSPFSLAQRRIASREREKVILIWGQTGCWNLQFFKITIFSMFVTAYPRGSVNYITFWGQSRFPASKKNPAK